MYNAQYYISKILMNSALISVCRSAVLSSGLAVMTWLAQALPVAAVPEQFHIAAVRNDMVDNCGLRVFPMFEALYTKRVFMKITFACFLPLAAVTAFARRAYNFRMKF